jgi:hypothetical protein
VAAVHAGWRGVTAGVLLDANGSEAWAVGGNSLWHFSGGGWSATPLPAQPALTRANTLGVVDGRVVIGGQVNKVGWALLYELDAGVPVDGGLDAGQVDAGMTFPVGWNGVQWRSPQVPRGFFSGGLSSTSGFMVGELGAIWQYGAGTFTELSRGFYGTVRDLAATDAGVFALVNDCLNASCTSKSGKVYTRFAPGDWRLLGATQPFGNELFAIAAKGSEVVVSTQNAVYRYDGTAWGSIPTTGLTGPIADLRFCGTNLYGVSRGATFYKGSATTLTAQGSVGNRDLFSLHCPTDAELWAAGDGVLWSKLGTGLWTARNSAGVTHASYRAVWSPGQGEAFAFGDARYGVYWNTAALKVIDGAGGILPDVVWGLWGSRIDNLYAVGSSVTPSPFGFALRFDGIAWRLVDSGSQRAVTAIDGWSPSEIWLGTEGGGLLRAVPPP